MKIYELNKGANLLPLCQLQLLPFQGTRVINSSLAMYILLFRVCGATERQRTSRLLSNIWLFLFYHRVGMSEKALLSHWKRMFQTEMLS